MFVILVLNPWWGPRKQKYSLGGYGPTSCFSRLHSHVTQRNKWTRANGNDHLHIHWYGHTPPGTPWMPNSGAPIVHNYGEALAATSARPDWETAARFLWVDADGQAASDRCEKIVSTIQGDFVSAGQMAGSSAQSCQSYRQDYAWKNGITLPYFDKGSPKTLSE